MHTKNTQKPATLTWRISYGGLLQLKESKVTPLKYTFNAEYYISYAGYLGLSLVISTQFTLEMCVAA